MHIFTKLCCLLFLAASVPALADNSGPHWLEVRTPHFTVLTNASEKDGRHVASQLERMRAVFHVILPAASDDAAGPITVIALKDKKSFRTLEPPDYLAKNQIDLAGLFLRTQDKNYVLLRLDAEGDHPFATVYHEYTHYMLRKTEDWMPLWLNEGLAEFYQNTDLRDKDVRMGEPSSDDILYLRQSRLLPLSTLLTVDHASPYYHDEQKGSVFYAESWALTHYLEVNDYQHRTDHVRDYAQRLIQHEDSVTAAQHAFGDLKKLEQALNAYVQQSNFSEFKLTAPVTFAEDSFEVRPVTTTEADTVRAGVLLNVQRNAEAEALLESVLKADPNNALAHETMGELKFHEQDTAAAKKWYGEAVQLDSKSYLAQYYFAVMSMNDGDHGHDDAIEQSLLASIKLNPRFAPADDALAQFYASRDKKLEEAHRFNLAAVQLEPEVLAYRRNTAEVLVQEKQFHSAILVLQAARKTSKSTYDMGSIDGRIKQIESFEAAAEKAEKQPQGDVVTTIEMNGKRSIPVQMNAAESEPEYPAGPPAGPHHKVAGVLRNIKCSYPAVLTVTLDRPGKPIALYANNYFKIEFSTGNYEPPKEIDPCKGIEGMKASVEYGEVKDPRVAGQILTIELSK